VKRGNEAGYIDVFLNGSKLENGVDFTAVTATNITLTSPAALNDVVDIICYAVFELSTAPTKDVVAYTVSTVEALASVPSSYTTAIVKDLNRGGTFIWSSTGTANGLTVFTGATGYWTKQEQKNVLQETSYATKTESASIAGTTHSAGTAYILSLTTALPAYSYGLIELDVTTTTSGMIKMLANGSDIYGDQPSGILFSTATILADGTENNRILSTTKYTFALASGATAITNVSIESDSVWAGTVTTLKLFTLDVKPIDFGITPNDAIDKNYTVGMKSGTFNRGDIALGNTGTLMSLQYDGIIPVPAFNTAIGHYALSANQLGDENTAIGAMALMSNEGSDNVAVGYSALKLNTKGQENTAIGYKAGASNTTGYKNSYLGFWAGVRNNTGIENTIMGWQPNTAGVSKSFITAIGSRAGSGYIGGSNTFLGAYSGVSTSGQEDINASLVTSIGNESRPRGNSSVAVGFQATIGTEAILADYAIAIGRNANAVLTENIAVGYLASASGAGGAIAIGKSATTSGGDQSIAIGKATIASAPRSLAIGDGAYAKGQQSIAIGALTVAGTGDYNTNIGGRSGLAFNGTGNTFLGWFAGNQAVTYDNCTLVGASTAVTGSNQVQIGNSSTTTYVYGTIQNRSDIRDKDEIQDSDLGLDFINKLRPVKYKWDLRDSYFDMIENEEGIVEKVAIAKDGSKKGKRFHYGLIAQELKEVSDTIGIDFGGLQDHSINGGSDVMSIGYDELISPLIKAVQELAARVKQLEQ
jgi:hypothetical protein